jgi:integrase
VKGHIRERSPGRWAIVIDIRDPETGRRKRKWHSFEGTKREAQTECSRLITAVNGGGYAEPSKLKLGEYLETWLGNVQTQLAPKTFERYSDIVRKNINPLLGGVVLTSLRPVGISAAYAKALQSGRRDGSGGLSAATVLYMHRVLRHALRQAVVWNMLTRNPADAVTTPRVERKQMRALNADETARLLARFRPTRMFVPVLLGGLCGLRRGEIAAIKWKRVDLTACTISVVESIEQTNEGTRAKNTKSGRGRIVALPSLVVEELARHRVRQAEELLKLGVRQNGDTLLVLREDGVPLLPSSLTHRFAEIIAKSDLPRIRFHDLRHSHATHLLSAGVHPKIAQERLGHSTVGITLDLYSHVLPGMQEDAAGKVDLAIRAAIDTAAKAIG